MDKLKKIQELTEKLRAARKRMTLAANRGQAAERRSARHEMLELYKERDVLLGLREAADRPRRHGRMADLVAPEVLAAITRQPVPPRRAQAAAPAERPAVLEPGALPVPAAPAPPGQVVDAPKPGLTGRVLEALQAAPAAGITPQQLATQIEASPKQVADALGALLGRGKVRRLAKGLYAPEARAGERREGERRAPARPEGSGGGS